MVFLMNKMTVDHVIQILKAGGAARDRENADDIDDVDNLRASLGHGVPHLVYFNCGDSYDGRRMAILHLRRGGKIAVSYQFAERESSTAFWCGASPLSPSWTCPPTCAVASPAASVPTPATCSPTGSPARSVGPKTRPRSTRRISLMPKPTTDDTIWIQVKATKAEAEELTLYAASRGFDPRKGGRSAWMAALALGTGREGTEGSLAISGAIARDVEAAAQAEGLSVPAWLRRALKLTAVFHAAGRHRTATGEVTS